MENPFITRYQPCTDCADGSYSIEKCYNGDPRFISVTVPYGEQPLVFAKGTVRVTCLADACADTCPDEAIKPKQPQPYDKAVLTGEAIYAGEWGTDAKLRCQTVELTPENTLIAGESYAGIDTFCIALSNLIQDCECDCE